MMKKIRYIFFILFQVVAIASFAQMTAPSDPGGDPEGGAARVQRSDSQLHPAPRRQIRGLEVPVGRR